MLGWGKYCHYLNSLLQFVAIMQTLDSFPSNTAWIAVDCMSYEMLNHLPDSWKLLLRHAFYQNWWLNKTLPSICKQSVKKKQQKTILKRGKPRSAIVSYRSTELSKMLGCALILHFIQLIFLPSASSVTHHQRHVYMIPPKPTADNLAIQLITNSFICYQTTESDSLNLTVCILTTV